MVTGFYGLVLCAVDIVVLGRIPPKSRPNLTDRYKEQ